MSAVSTTSNVKAKIAHVAVIIASFGVKSGICADKNFLAQKWVHNYLENFSIFFWLFNSEYTLKNWSSYRKKIILYLYFFHFWRGSRPKSRSLDPSLPFFWNKSVNKSVYFLILAFLIYFHIVYSKTKFLKLAYKIQQWVSYLSRSHWFWVVKPGKSVSISALKLQTLSRIYTCNFWLNPN